MGRRIAQCNEIPTKNKEQQTHFHFIQESKTFILRTRVAPEKGERLNEIRLFSPTAFYSLKGIKYVEGGLFSETEWSFPQ